MKKYDSYKDSGIEWMGEIPSHWSLIRMRYLCDIGTGDKDTENAEVDGDFPFFVRSQTIERISTYSYDGEAILTAGDGVGVCKVWHYINGKFDYHQRVYRMSDFRGVNGKFLFYYLRENFITEVIKLSAKSTVDSLRRPMFQDFKIAFGSLAEQTTIANYLDHKTTQIDNLITKKERLIELLQEERTAIINQAVTKGLDPNVPMKDSGIEWLGEIPEHWGISKLKYLTSIISKGTTPSTVGKDLIDDGQIKFIKAENIFENKVQQLPSFYIDEETHALLKRSQLQEGDILLVIAGATIGKVAILNSEYVPANTNQAVCFIRVLNKEYIYFIWLWLQTYYIKEVIKLEATQAAQPNLSMEDIGNFILPDIDLIELREIIEFVQNRTNKINLSTNTINKEIELLKEYKTALISEVVTGKVDVRENGE
ncbi:MAG: restriction endonuclease subunit S [bacterium]